MIWDPSMTTTVNGSSAKYGRNTYYVHPTLYVSKLNISKKYFNIVSTTIHIAKFSTKISRVITLHKVHAKIQYNIVILSSQLHKSHWTHSWYATNCLGHHYVCTLAGMSNTALSAVVRQQSSQTNRWWVCFALHSRQGEKFRTTPYRTVEELLRPVSGYFCWWKVSR